MKILSTFLAILSLLFPPLPQRGGQVIISPAPSSGPAAPPTGMLVWYRGDSLTCTGGCSGTNVVATLVDKSTNTNDAPHHIGYVGTSTYLASGFNSLPGVTLSATGSDLFSFTSALNLETASTICTVLKATSGKGTLVSGNSASVGYWFFNTSEQGADSVNTVGLGNGTAAADTSYHSMCMTYDGTTIKFYLDGATDGSATPSATITATDTGIGLNVQTGLETFHGVLMDIVIYNTALPAGGGNSIATWFTYTSSRY